MEVRPRPAWQVEVRNLDGLRVQMLRESKERPAQLLACKQPGHRMKTQIQELMALYHMIDEIGQIIDSENSGLSAEQRLDEIQTTIRNYFKNDPS